jgi:hypothetical protein
VAVGDAAHRPAQDLSRTGLGQRGHDRDVLEGGDGADVVAYELDEFGLTSLGSRSTAAFRTTNPLGTSPFRASATPMTAHSATSDGRPR